MSVMIFSIHVLACVLLIMLVLLQAGKGSGMGSSLGGSNQTLFDNNRTTGILGKATTIVAIIFMLTSLTMGYMRNKETTSIITSNPELFATAPDSSFENNEVEKDSNLSIEEDVEDD